MKELQELTKLIEEEIKNGAFPGANYAIVTPQRTYLGTVGNKSLIPSIPVSYTHLTLPTIRLV